MEQTYDVYIGTKVRLGNYAPSDITYRKVPADKVTELVKSHPNVTSVTVHPSPGVYGVHKLGAAWAAKVFDTLEDALAFAALESAKGTESEVRLEEEE